MNPFKKNMKQLTLAVLATSIFASAAIAIPPSYKVEEIPNPPTKMKTDQIDGLTFLPDGRLVVALPSGEIYFYNTKSKKWSLFAEGLHNPLGLVAESNTTLVVAQRPELTRISDTDGDGVADLYATISDEFGMSGNYHEFNFTPVPSGDGGYFFGLGTASKLAGVRAITRGKFSADGRHGRMHSSAPYRGWVMKVTKDGEIIPWASGVRTPNGLGMDLKGNLYSSDNQGDWLSSSKLHHIEKGDHHGHVASLAWRDDLKDKGVKGTPIKLPVKVLDSVRKRPAIIFPHGIMANSPTKPIAITEQANFGPFTGQMLIGEMNKPRIIRLMLEEVDGQMQGACIPFIDGAPLRTGNNRIAWAPDGSLYVGHTKHTWPGNSGIQRVVFNGKMPFELQDMKLKEDGFQLTFTKALDAKIAADPKTWQFKTYYYTYHQKYGGPQEDVQDVKVTKVKLSQDGKVVDLKMPLKAWYLHEMNFPALKSKAGEKPGNTLAVYTLNRLIKNTPPPPVQYGNAK